MLSSEFIQSLSEDELSLLLYFINVVSRPLQHSIHQDIGMHYCNFRSEAMKNMDIKRCGAFEDKLDSNNLKY